jgi:tetratricopeptide (TPR) repeat protein
VKLNLTSATAALKVVTDRLAHFPPARCLFLLLVAFAWTQAGALPGASGARTPSQRTAHTREIELRLRALDAAKSTGEAAAIANASRSVAAPALREFAELQLARGEAAEAAETYRRSLDFEDVPGGRLDLALAYLSAGRADQALSQATDVLVADPQNARAWRVQGQVWMSKGNNGQAATSLQKSAALQASAETSRLLRIALARTGKEGHPQHKLEDSAIRAPKIAAAELQIRERRLRRILGGALNDLGTAEARQEQFSLALAHFHEAERWQADTPGLLRNIGMAASRTGDYAEAARALRPALAADPKDEIARSMLGMALFATRSYDEAARTFAVSGNSLLERPELMYAWAESLVKLNRYEEAAALLDKLEGQPLSTGTQMLVAQAWSEMGNYPRTVRLCQRVLQANPKLAEAHYLAGLALIHEDRPTEAAAEFRAELQQAPTDTEAEYHLAFVLFQLSQEPEAVRLLHDVLARNPDHPDANYELGKALLNAGKTAEAIPYLEAAARLKPDLDAVHYQLQSAYRSVGRKADADREANIYRAMKNKSRNISLPAPRQEQSAPPESQ